MQNRITEIKKQLQFDDIFIYGDIINIVINMNDSHSWLHSDGSTMYVDCIDDPLFLCVTNFHTSVDTLYHYYVKDQRAHRENCPAIMGWHYSDGECVVYNQEYYLDGIKQRSNGPAHSIFNVLETSEDDDRYEITFMSSRHEYYTKDEQLPYKRIFTQNGIWDYNLDSGILEESFFCVLNDFRKFD